MRVLAVDDGSFYSGLPDKRRGKTLLIGAIVSDFKIERLLLSTIEVDGLDATEKLINMVKRSQEAIDLILLPSISCGGFNLIDAAQIYEILKTPLLVINREEPNDARVEQALRNHFPDWKERLAIITHVGHPKKLILDESWTLFFHVFGMSQSMVSPLLREMTIFGQIPEPLRVAQILVRGLSKEKSNDIISC